MNELGRQLEENFDEDTLQSFLSSFGSIKNFLADHEGYFRTNEVDKNQNSMEKSDLEKGLFMIYSQGHLDTGPENSFEVYMKSESFNMREWSEAYRYLQPDTTSEAPKRILYSDRIESKNNPYLE